MPRSHRSSSLRRVSRPRLYEQLVESIRRHIEETGLRPGDRLPPERELAAKLGVSRVSIGQALVALEVLGVIDVRHGDGAVLLEQNVPQQAPVRRASKRGFHAVRDVLEAREVLEVAAAELAARRRTEGDLSRIDGALEALREERRDGPPSQDADQAFHEAVAAAAHSTVVAGVLGDAAPVLYEACAATLADPGYAQQAFLEHSRTAFAIRARDPRAAADSTLRQIRICRALSDEGAKPALP